MSIKLKNVERVEVNPLQIVVKARYEIAHETPGDTGTRLTQDLDLVLDPVTGKVGAKLTLSDLEADNLDAALEKMASWCERMAIALREPREVVAHLPIIIKTQGSCEE